MATKKTTDPTQGNTAPEQTETPAQGNTTSGKFPEPTLQDNIDRMNEPVTIRLFKGLGRYKNDIIVRVDGIRFQLKRGIPIQVPRKVYDVVQQQLAQDQETAQLIESKEAEFDKIAKVFE